MNIFDSINLPNNKIAKFYQGNGKISSSDGVLYDCTFECKQTVSGLILCKCTAPGIFISPIDLTNYQILLQVETLTKNSIKFSDCRLLDYDDTKSEMVLSSRELTVDYDVDWQPYELNFYLSNFEFIGLAWETIVTSAGSYGHLMIHINYKDYDISIRRLDQFESIMRDIKKTKGIDITSIMTIRLPKYDFYSIDVINNAIELASNICNLLSLADGHKVEWIYYDVISNDKKKIRSYHRVPVKNWPYHSWLLILDNPNEDIETFLTQCLDNYTLKKNNLRLNECIEIYLNALLEENYLDFRCLLLSVLLDSLTGDMYPNMHNEFMNKLKKFVEDIKLDISINELEEIIDIRNNLAHTAHLLEMYEPSNVIWANKRNKLPYDQIKRYNTKSKIDQYFLLQSFVVRVILAILQYDGYYYDWRFHVPGEWMGADMTARIRMRYTP